MADSLFSRIAPPDLTIFQQAADLWKADSTDEAMPLLQEMAGKYDTQTVIEVMGQYGVQLQVAGSGGSGETPIQETPEFQRLITLNRMMQEARANPAVGNAADLEWEYLQAQDAFLELHPELAGTGRWNRYRELTNLMLEYQNTPRWIQNATENVVNSVGPILDPLAFGGDVVRTFGVRHANVREMQENQGVDPRDPAAWLFGAGVAAFGTMKDLGFGVENALPFRVEPAEEPGTGFMGSSYDVSINPESGWVIYAPYGTSPYQNPNVVTGEEFNERFGIAERLGVESEQGKFWLGVATEVMTDPLLWTDALGLAARGLRAAGRLTGVTALRDAGLAVDDFASGVIRATSVRGATEFATSVSPLAEGLANLVNRGVNRLLDIQVPANFLYSPGARRVAGDLTGGPAGGVIRPRIRDLFFQLGQTEWFRNTRLGRIAGADAAGAAAGDVALGMEQQIQALTVRTLDSLGTALTDGLPRRTFTLRLPGERIAVRGANVVTEPYQGYVNALGGAALDFVDTNPLFAGTITPEMENRLRAIAETYNVPYSDTVRRFKNSTQVLGRFTLETGYELSGYGDFITALRTVTNNLGIDYGDTRRALETMYSGRDLQALELGGVFRTGNPAQTGATPSTAAGRIASQDIIDDWVQHPDHLDFFIGEIRDELNRMGRGDLAAIDPLQYLEAMQTGYFRRAFFGVSEGPETTRAVLNALRNNDIVMMREVHHGDIVGQFDTAFGSGAGDVVSRYIEGVTPSRPRLLPGQLPPPMAMPRADDLAQEIAMATGTMPTTADVQAFISGFRRGGDAEAFANAVNRRFGTSFKADDMSALQRPALWMSTDEVARLLTESTGNTVTPQQVADVVYGRPAGSATGTTNNYTYFQETLKLLEGYAQSGYPMMGAPNANIPSAFQSRLNLNLEQLASLVRTTDPMAAVASAGNVAARSVRSQTFIGRTYDALAAEGLIVPGDAVRARLSEMGPTNPKAFAHLDWNGEPYVIVSDNPAWGPLAGQAIPEDAARLIVYAQSAGQAADDAIQRWIALWRRGKLAPLSTSMNNLIGNYLLMGSVTPSITPFDLLQNTNRAARLRRTLLETGRLPDEFAGYEHYFSFINQSARAGFTDNMDQLLQGLAQGQFRVEDALSKAERLVQIGTETAPVGFLGLFRYGEEVSRTSAFLTMYDNLVARGVDRAEALERASHFGANAGFNYGAAPLIPDAMRRGGLAAFPQFRWFSIGRYARVMAENPITYARLENFRQLVNAAGTEDLSEGEAVTARMSDWLLYQHPMNLPWMNEDGTGLWYNFGRMLPYAIDWRSLVSEPASGGLAQGIIDGAIALVEGTGVGPITRQYGTQWYNPGSPPEIRALQFADQLAQQYLPLYNIPRGLTQTFGQGNPVVREVLGPSRIQEVMRYDDNKSVMDMVALSASRVLNLDWSQYFLRSIGFSTWKVNTNLVSADTLQLEQEMVSRYDNERRAISLAIQDLSTRLALEATSPTERERIEYDLSVWKARLQELENKHREELLTLPRMLGR